MNELRAYVIAKDLQSLCDELGTQFTEPPRACGVINNVLIIDCVCATDCATLWDALSALKEAGQLLPKTRVAWTLPSLSNAVAPGGVALREKGFFIV